MLFGFSARLVLLTMPLLFFVQQARSPNRMGRKSVSNARPEVDALQPTPPVPRPSSARGLASPTREKQLKGRFKSRRSFVSDTPPSTSFINPTIQLTSPGGGSSTKIANPPGSLLAASPRKRALPLVPTNPPAVVAHTNPGTDSGDVTASSPPVNSGAGKVHFLL